MKKLITAILTCFVSISVIGQTSLDNNRFARAILNSDDKSESFRHNMLKSGHIPSFAKQPGYIKSSATIKHQLDSAISKSWDETTSQWITGPKDEYYYDQKENMLLNKYYMRDNNNNCWVPHDKYECSYDLYGNIINFISYEWDDLTDFWIESLKQEFFYDTDGNLIKEIVYFKDNIVSQWKMFWKAEYDYDAYGNKVLFTDYEWDVGANQWLEYGKIEYSYNGNGNLLLYYVYHWNEIDNKWDLTFKCEFINNEDGKPLLRTAYECDEIAGQWLNYYKVQYSYDVNGNILAEIYSFWYDYYNDWKKYFKDEYTYDYSYDDSDIIIPHYPFNLFGAHEILNMPLSHVSYTWQDYLCKWIEDNAETYYYSTVDVGFSENEELKIGFYPNPVTNILKIENNTASDINEIKLYNLNGQKVLNIEPLDNTIDLSGISPGMYIIELSTDRYVLKQKLLKQ